MAYSTNPHLPKARATALRLLLVEDLSVHVVANKCGVHRSTVWRWKKKWDDLNRRMQKENCNRPRREKTTRLHGYSWSIPTLSSRPHSCSHAIPDDIVRLVLAARYELKRCAEVIWHHVTTALHLQVSLSSVRRILRRHHCFDGARKPRVRRDNPRRPHVTKPGELVQTDTIHHVDPKTGRRVYYYTVIDLPTRMTHVILATKLSPGLAAHAVLATKLSPGLAAHAVLEAQTQWGFTLSTVQADNGPEHGRYFEQQMQRAGIQARHSRLHRPNDNAHIERFNRTLQEECIGSYWRKSVPLSRQRETLAAYLDFYNQKRVHLGIQMQTPAEMLQRS